MPIVTVIIPVFNTSSILLLPCIDSVLNQSLKEIEVILINNGSSRECSTILTSYAKRDPRIKLFNFETNQGYSKAMNIGLSKATGKYIHFLDSDDFLDNRAYKLWVEHIERFEVDMMFLAFNNFNMLTLDFCGVYSFPYPEKSFCFEDVMDNLFPQEAQVWNKFYRRDFLLRTGNKFNEQLKNACPDALFSYRNYLSGASFCNFKRPMMTYRRNVSGGVVSRLASRECHFIDEILIFENCLLDLFKYKDKETVLRLIEIIIVSLNYFYSHIHPDNKLLWLKDLRVFLGKIDKFLILECNRRFRVNIQLYDRFFRPHIFLMKKIKTVLRRLI